ncbi:MAG TPA: HAMP domain-containing sensor histidine kinase [Xanthobacteraceae bacterium]|nr:HAMP domain-containing sensor histidine kinase [Xanthobacteraceae bacterium]
MRRLYLQVYLTIVASLFLVVVTAGVVWHFGAGMLPFEQPVEVAGEVIVELVPPASAPAAVQQQAIDRLARRLGADLALFGRSDEPLAAAGRPLPAPDRSRAGSRLRTMAGPAVSIRLPDGRWLVARLPFSPRPKAGLLAAFLGAIALAVALGARPVVRRLTGRLERLQRGVESLGAGDLRARVKVEGRDEVAQLAQSFNQAAARIESLVDAHKMLLANASHELRTPLTRIRLGLELVEAEPARKAELTRDIAELDQLVDEILLVSRLDATIGLDLREDIDLMALAAEECARYEACSVRGRSVMVRGDPTLLRRMIRNLLENAKLHGEPPVEVTIDRQGDQVTLSVSDCGEVIAADARSRLFSTFYRIPGRSGPKDTGLGLALVRQIARRHGGDAAYVPERGNCFTVTLPVARN